MSNVDESRNSPVFTPSNEPYLGLESLHVFDQLIIAILDANSQIAPRTHKVALSGYQQAACQLIPQGISLALSIRELIRQGYLFGALVLVRPLGERAVILLHLKKHPADIAKWERGWQGNDAPSMSTMLKGLGGHVFPGVEKSILAPHNSLTHAKPDCAVWSLVDIGDGQFGHGVSKILDNPKMCERVCLESIGWLAAISGMMSGLFDDE